MTFVTLSRASSNLITWSSNSKSCLRKTQISPLPSFSLWTIYTLFLLIGYGPGSPFVSSVDPCTVVGKNFQSYKPVSISQLTLCLRSFPFQSKNAKTVLDTITKMLINIYPSTNLAIKSPDMRLYSQTDLRKEFARIKNTNYSSDFDFHQDLKKTIFSLKDAHTGWFPDCFGNYFEIANGLPMVQVFNSTTNTTIVKIAPKKVFQALSSGGYNYVLQPTAQYLNFSNSLGLSVYYGAQVLKIDGLNTSDYVTKRANDAGYYRNLQPRINNLFVRLTSDSFQLGNIMLPPLLPKNDTLTLTILRKGSKKSETIKIPYVVSYYGNNFNSRQQYYNYNCVLYNARAVKRSENMKTRRLTNFHNFLEPRKVLPESLRSQTKSEKNINAGAVMRLDSGDLAVYMLPDGVTAVMVVPTFTHPDGTLRSTMDYLYLGFAALRDSPARRVIIDLSNNGGGVVEAAAFLTQLFFPSKFPSFPIQYKAKELAQESYRNASNSKTPTHSDYDYRSPFFTDKNGNPMNSPSSFFIPLKNTTHNNFTDPYSSHIYFSNWFNSYHNRLPNKPLFASKQILILTNGLCYSSCAIFSYQMRQLYNIKFVNVGGDQSKSTFQIGDGAVGFVDTFDNYYRNVIVGLQLMKSKNAPSPLPVPGVFGFNFAQAYNPKNPDIPQEFSYEPGQYKLHYTDDSVANEQILWQQAAKFFS